MAHSHSKYECVSLLYVQCMQLCGALQRTLIALRVRDTHKKQIDLTDLN